MKRTLILLNAIATTTALAFSSLVAQAQDTGGKPASVVNPAAALQHRYSFNTDASDSAGHADGALQGAAGGVVAWLILRGGVWLVNHNLGELSHVYASLFQLNHLNPADSLSLVLLPAALGWFGAWLSVGRHLALIEP